MNGRVVAVNVNAGDTAAADCAILVLDVMKMAHALRVPAAARFRTVHIVQGTRVARDSY